MASTRDRTEPENAALTRRALLGGAAAGGVALAAGVLSTPVALALAEDAITAARFEISINGNSLASFSELGGIVSEVDTVDYLSSAGKDNLLKKLAERRIAPTVTLLRGLTSGLELWSWHQAVLLGDLQTAIRDCDLTIFDATGAPVARYHLEMAWPSKLEVGALKAGASEVLMETVTLTCEHLQRVAP